TVRTADTIGRALYIVDATTGARLWWAGPSSSGADEVYSDMQYSMPATPKVLDTNGDGLADQMYIGDMGGQVWRFDINNGERGSSLVDGAVIAEFAGNSTTDNRRFYNSPDLFGFRYGNNRYLGLVIGSGYRAHPLDAAVEDRIYMLRIPDASSAPDSNLDDKTDYSDYGWTENDLYDATDNLIGEGTTAQQAAGAASLAGAKGWYLRLIDYADGAYKGEKVLSESTTVNNQIFITTYEPSPNTSGCVPLAGKSRLYHLWAEDAQPVKNYDKTVKNSDTELTKEDRIVELMDPLPPDPQRMRVDGEDVICVGARCAKEDTITGIVETFWYQDEE
ncbi:MAG: pilus assembly protein PilY, partial [Pseudomonadales bacterium]|nr:pilus assembly protein PilY [Pseudomonadales bacterium]